MFLIFLQFLFFLKKILVVFVDRKWVFGIMGGFGLEITEDFWNLFSLVFSRVLLISLRDFSFDWFSKRIGVIWFVACGYSEFVFRFDIISDARSLSLSRTFLGPYFQPKPVQNENPFLLLVCWGLYHVWHMFFNLKPLVLDRWKVWIKQPKVKFNWLEM